MTTILPLAAIKQWRPCTADYNKLVELYPDGVPLTLEAGKALLAAGVDAVWGAVHLLNQDERTAFILFTLRQRQAHLVTLLTKADLPTHAEAVAALRFDTIEDAEAALPVLDAAWDAARAAAWDAAWAAAWDAAWAAAWDAAWAAAWAAARAAAWDAARAAARDAAWDVARAAAWDAAQTEQLEWIFATIERREEVQA